MIKILLVLDDIVLLQTVLSILKKPAKIDYTYDYNTAIPMIIKNDYDSLLFFYKNNISYPTDFLKRIKGTKKKFESIVCMTHLTDLKETQILRKYDVDLFVIERGEVEDLIGLLGL